MSFSRLIRLSAEKNSIFNGKAVHARIIVSGTDPDVRTNNHLLTMYAKLGHIDYAQKLFDKMVVRNLVTWTSLISAYSQIGCSEKALNCFRSMALDNGITLNNYTYVAAVSACAQIRALRSGKEIHGRIYRTEESVNSFVSNCLVNSYGKCGLLKLARLVFDTIPEVNTVSCVSLITSFMQCGEYEEALRIFLRSLRTGVQVNEFLYGSILGACAALGYLEVGMQLQCLAIKCGVRMDQFVVTSLVNFYAKCGALELAYRAFREADKPNVTAWTALIGGYVPVGKAREAIHFFQEMLLSGIKPNEQTFASVLGAFGKENDIQSGVQLHSLIIKMRFETFTFVSNALLDFYAKVNRLEESFKAFGEMEVHDIVSWNALIAGCLNCGRYEEAIQCIRDMLSKGVEFDPYTYSSLLSICGDLPATEWGKQTHCCIIKHQLDHSNVVVGSALVDMYAKCGRLNDAKKVFNILPCRNLVSWNSMISGYAQHGFGKEALEIHDVMVKNGIKPNDITFIGVLSSCVHVGASEKALQYFDSMIKEFGITPRSDHFACIVNLFSRKGQMREAYDFIKSYHGDPGKVVWRCLLSGCVSNKDLELAIYAAEKILSIDPNDASVYVMLSNIYADLSMWKEASEVRQLMKQKMLRKEIGYSWT